MSRVKPPTVALPAKSPHPLWVCWSGARLNVAVSPRWQHTSAGTTGRGPRCCASGVDTGEEWLPHHQLQTGWEGAGQGAGQGAGLPTGRVPLPTVVPTYRCSMREFSAEAFLAGR